MVLQYLALFVLQHHIPHFLCRHSIGKPQLFRPVLPRYAPWSLNMLYVLCSSHNNENRNACAVYIYICIYICPLFMAGWPSHLSKIYHMLISYHYILIYIPWNPRVECFPPPSHLVTTGEGQLIGPGQKCINFSSHKMVPWGVLKS